MSRLRFALTLVIALVAIMAIAACGSPPVQPVKHQPTPQQLHRQCPPGNSQMGCAVPLTSGPPVVRGLGLTPPAVGVFPDVSDWQGHPNWTLAKPHISMAVVKAWENARDPDFLWNVGQLKRLHISWSAYDFVRSCNASGFVAALRSVGGPTLPPVLDMEVPSARGCAPTLANQVWSAFHIWPLIYTSPGSWPGGSPAGLKLWIADYGPSFPCLWTCQPVAWQFTDGQFNTPVFIPGIGKGDVSRDFGFSKLAPNPLARFHYARFASVTFSSPYGPLVERNVVRTYDVARTHARRNAAKLAKLEVELRFLAARASYIAFKQRVNQKPSWGLYYRGWRYQQLVRRAEGHTV